MRALLFNPKFYKPRNFQTNFLSSTVIVSSSDVLPPGKANRRREIDDAPEQTGDGDQLGEGVGELKKETSSTTKIIVQLNDKLSEQDVMKELKQEYGDIFKDLGKDLGNKNFYLECPSIDVAKKIMSEKKWIVNLSLPADVSKLIFVPLEDGLKGRDVLKEVANVIGDVDVGLFVSTNQSGDLLLKLNFPSKETSSKFMDHGLVWNGKQVNMRYTKDSFLRPANRALVVQLNGKLSEEDVLSELRQEYGDVFNRISRDNRNQLYVECASVETAKKVLLGKDWIVNFARNKGTPIIYLPLKHGLNKRDVAKEVMKVVGDVDVDFFTTENESREQFLHIQFPSEEISSKFMDNGMLWNGKQVGLRYGKAEFYTPPGRLLVVRLNEKLSASDVINELMKKYGDVFNVRSEDNRNNLFFECPSMVVAKRVMLDMDWIVSFATHPISRSIYVPLRNGITKKDVLKAVGGVVRNSDFVIFSAKESGDKFLHVQFHSQESSSKFMDHGLMWKGKQIGLQYGKGNLYIAPNRTLVVRLHKMSEEKVMTELIEEYGDVFNSVSMDDKNQLYFECPSIDVARNILSSKDWIAFFAVQEISSTMHVPLENGLKKSDVLKEVASVVGEDVEIIVASSKHGNSLFLEFPSKEISSKFMDIGMIWNGKQVGLRYSENLALHPSTKLVVNLVENLTESEVMNELKQEYGDVFKSLGVKKGNKFYLECPSIEVAKKIMLEKEWNCCFSVRKNVSKFTWTQLRNGLKRKDVLKEVTKVVKDVDLFTSATENGEVLLYLQFPSPETAASFMDCKIICNGRQIDFKYGKWKGVLPSSNRTLVVQLLDDKLTEREVINELKEEYGDVFGALGVDNKKNFYFECPSMDVAEKIMLEKDWIVNYASTKQEPTKLIFVSLQNGLKKKDILNEVVKVVGDVDVGVFTAPNKNGETILFLQFPSQEISSQFLDHGILLHGKQVGLRYGKVKPIPSPSRKIVIQLNDKLSEREVMNALNREYGDIFSSVENENNNNLYLKCPSIDVARKIMLDKDWIVNFSHRKDVSKFIFVPLRNGLKRTDVLKEVAKVFGDVDVGVFTSTNGQMLYVEFPSEEMSAKFMDHGMLWNGKQVALNYGEHERPLQFPSERLAINCGDLSMKQVVEELEQEHGDIFKHITQDKKNYVFIDCPSIEIAKKIMLEKDWNMHFVPPRPEKQHSMTAATFLKKNLRRKDVVEAITEVVGDVDVDIVTLPSENTEGHCLNVTFPSPELCTQFVKQGMVWNGQKIDFFYASDVRVRIICRRLVVSLEKGLSESQIMNELEDQYGEVFTNTSRDNKNNFYFLCPTIHVAWSIIMEKDWLVNFAIGSRSDNRAGRNLLVKLNEDVTESRIRKELTEEYGDIFSNFREDERNNLYFECPSIGVAKRIVLSKNWMLSFANAQKVTCTILVGLNDGLKRRDVMQEVKNVIGDVDVDILTSQTNAGGEVLFLRFPSERMSSKFMNNGMMWKGKQVGLSYV